jgi:hypothetical protein
MKKVSVYTHGGNHIQTHKGDIRIIRFSDGVVEFVLDGKSTIIVNAIVIITDL